MKKLFKILSVSTFVLALVACGYDNQIPAQNISNEEDLIQNISNENGQNEIVFLLHADPTSLDPHRQMDILSAETEMNLFRGLTAFYEGATLQPTMSTEFYQTDPYTWIFHIRQGVTFHNGESLNAEAVWLNFDRVLDRDFASPRLFLLDMITDVTVLDDYIVQFTTYFPFAPLPYNFAHSPTIVAPAAILEERNGGYTVAQNPIGTGPFMLYSRQYGNEIQMIRFDDYFRGAPKIERLTYLVIPDSATRLLMLESGQAHATQISPVDAMTLMQDDLIDINLVDSTRAIFLGFNNSQPPFNDSRLRQAVDYAINRENILTGIVEGFGIVGTGPVSPVIQGGTQNLIMRETNLERARELVVEAGFEYGLNVTLYTNSGNPVQETILIYVQYQLSQIGINVEINLIEWGTFVYLTAVGGPDMFVHGWSTTTGDADYGIFQLFHSGVPGSGGNRAFHANPIIDSMLEDARATTDLDIRSEIYANISQHVVDEAVYIFLYYPIIPIATQGIDGIFIDFNGTSIFHNASLR